MTIEEGVFISRRIVPEKLTAFGFQFSDGVYRYEADFMDGAFHAVLCVTESGMISGRVIDTMNDEEYVPLRVESCEGAYVNAVRSAYAEWLAEIAAQCCTDEIFASEQANRIAAQIYETYGVKPDFPWESDRSGVFRHTDSAKWFGLIMHIRRKNLLKNSDEEPVDIINLKILPENSEAVTAQNGIYPAFHMNHKNWISVVLDGTLTDAEVMTQIAESFRLTDKRKKKS